jgi:protein SCO1
MMRSLVATTLVLAALFPVGAAESTAPLARDSLYQLQASLEDQDGRVRAWSSNRGKVRIVTMFYSNCPHACPLIIETIKAIEAALPLAQRQHLQIDLISFDPERDTPTRLKTLAQQRGIDDPRWRLHRASASDAHQLSALLGVRYRKLADGEFNHSSVLILLDAEGRRLTASTQIGAPDPKFIGAVRTALESSAQAQARTQ